MMIEIELGLKGFAQKHRYSGDRFDSGCPKRIEYFDSTTGAWEECKNINVLQKIMKEHQ